MVLGYTITLGGGKEVNMQNLIIQTCKYINVQLIIIHDLSIIDNK